MRIVLIMLSIISIVSALEFKDIDLDMTFKAWDKSTAPRPEEAFYLKDIAKNINKLEKINSQLEIVLNKKNLYYSSYNGIERDYKRIVNKLRINSFFYPFEKAQAVLFLQILDKVSRYKKDNTYETTKVDSIKFVYSFIRKKRDSDARYIGYKEFQNVLKGWRVTNSMLEKAFNITGKMVKKIQ